MRDISFEVMAQVCGMDWQNLTQNERGRLNSALAQLRGLPTPPDERELPALIEARAKACHAVYPEVALSPQMLVNHWSSIEGKARKLSVRVNARSRSDCPTCGGDRWVPAGVDDRGYDQSAPCPDCSSPPVDRRDHDSRVAADVPVSDPGARRPADSALSVTCVLCGEEIFEAERRSMYAQETSWQPAVSHRAGGGHHDRGKAWTRSGALAHERCVNALAKGRLHQRDLFTQSEQMKLT